MDDHTRRRKLIQGSLAAPLVLTVGKAGAAARTTFQACLRKSEQQPEPKHVVDEPDEAFRVSREIYEGHRRDGVGGDKAKKPETPWGRNDGNPNRQDRYVLGWDNQTFYRIDGSRLVPKSLDNAPGSVGRSSDVELRPTGKKVDVLAYFDDNGDVVGIAQQTNGGQWTMKRCYSSLVGMREDDTPRRYRWWG